jgi:hypothetical protein
MKHQDAAHQNEAALPDEDELFLENLASVHTIAAGMLESALKNLKMEASADITVLSRLEKSANALRRMEALILKRKRFDSGNGSEAA